MKAFYLGVGILVMVCHVGCNITDAVTVTIENRAATGDEVLLVTDANGTWGPAALTDDGQYVYVPSTQAWGVAYACRLSVNADKIVQVYYKTLADGRALSIPGCSIGDNATASYDVQVLGLTPNQRLVIEDFYEFDMSTSTGQVEATGTEFLAVLWQIEPPKVLGFLRQELNDEQNEIVVDVATAVAPASLLATIQDESSMVWLGISGLVANGRWKGLSTELPTEEERILAVPPSSFLTMGELMEISATELSADSKHYRSTSQLVDGTVEVALELPEAWTMPTPHFVEYALRYKFDPLEGYTGTYHFSSYAFEPLYVDEVNVTSSWIRDTGRRSVTSPDVAAFATWFDSVGPFDLKIWNGGIEWTSSEDPNALGHTTSYAGVTGRL